MSRKSKRPSLVGEKKWEGRAGKRENEGKKRKKDKENGRERERKGQEERKKKLYAQENVEERWGKKTRINFLAEMHQKGLEKLIFSGCWCRAK